MSDFNSIVSYPGDGATTRWSFTFSGGYIAPEHVFVSVDDAAPTPATLDGAGTVVLDPAAPVGSLVTIFRKTPLDKPLVDWADGADISETNLDTATRQSVFVAAEATDTLNDLLTRTPHTDPTVAAPGMDDPTGQDGKVLALVSGRIGFVENDPAAAASSAAVAQSEAASATAARADTLAARDEVEAAHALVSQLRDDTLAARLANRYFPNARNDVPKGLVGLAISNGGSGGTDGDYTIPLTGSNLAAAAFIQITVSGGVITTATVAAPGFYVGNALDLGTADLSAVPGLVDASLALTGGDIIPSGEHYLTDHDTDPDQVTLILNNGGVAEVAAASVHWLNLAKVREYTEQLETQRDVVVIGVEDTPSTGTSTGTVNTFAIDTPVPFDAELRSVRLYSAQSAAWDLKIRRLARSGDNFAKVGDTAVVTIPAGVGPKTVELPEPLLCSAGEYIGWFAQGVHTYTSDAPATPYFAAAGDVDNFTDASTTKVYRMEIGFDLHYVYTTATRTKAIEAALNTASSAALAAKLVTDALVSDYTIGRPVDPAAAPGLAGANTFVYAQAVPAEGYLDTFSVYSSSSGTGYIKRFRRSGDVNTQIAGTDLAVTLEPGLNTFGPEVLGSYVVSKGDLLGFAAPANGVNFTSGISGDGEGYYGTSGNVSSFTKASSTKTIRLEMSFGLKLVADASQVGGSTVLPKQPGCTAIKTLGGRCDFTFNNAVAGTFRHMQATWCNFIGARLVLKHSSPVERRIGRASVTALARAADFGDSAKWTSAIPVTFNGRDSVVLPAVTGSKGVAFVVSDPIPLQHLPRTDGGASPLIGASVFLQDEGSWTLLGKAGGGTNLLNWATRSGDEWATRYNVGDCVSAPGDFLSTENVSTGIVAGFEFVTPGQAFTVAYLGDSIADGQGGGITYDSSGFVYEACKELTSLDGRCYLPINLAWSGSTTDTFERRFVAALEAGVVPDVLIIPIYSPNDETTTLTQASMDAMKLRVGSIVRLCREWNIRPILWTGMPSNPTDGGGNPLRPYGATDSLRVAHNSWGKAWAGRGIVVLDLASVMSGATVSGQVHMNDALQSDNIHPNDQGIQACKALVKSGVNHLNLDWAGTLVLT